MDMRILRLAHVCVAATFVLISGCGGMQNSGFGPNPGSTGSRSSGAVTISVIWPARSRLVPLASQCIVAVLSSGSTTYGSQVLVPPTAGNTSSVTFAAVPIGPATLTATAFPTVNGGGTALAAGSAPVQVVANQTSAVTVTMASTINHLVLNPPAPSVEANQSIPLMVTAVNSTGAIVLLSPGKLQWSSDNHTYATVDTSGVVVGIADGSANITVTDTESLKSVSTKVTVTPAPISWWKAEGNALDAEGLNNGTVSGGVSYTTGHLGQAFWFNGTDGVINMGDPSSLALTGSLTIDAWVYPLSIPSASQVGAEILMRADDRDALDPYYLCINSDGNYYFQVCNAANTNAIVKAAATLNVWQHVTATLDNTTGDMRLYINGQVAAETTTTVRPFQNLDTIAPHGVAIGNSPGAGTVWHYPFNGYIDELKIYNVVAPPGG